MKKIINDEEDLNYDLFLTKLNNEITVVKNKYFNEFSTDAEKYYNEICKLVTY